MAESLKGVWNALTGGDGLLSREGEGTDITGMTPNEKSVYQYSVQNDLMGMGYFPAYAYGLRRVPYDDYPTMLHEGERVLTAIEARRYDKWEDTHSLLSSITQCENDTQKQPRFDVHGYAYGLSRVPYDNFPALLHAGERVLTASETRSRDSKSLMPQITITGNVFNVRDDSDIDNIGKSIAREVVKAFMVAG